MFAQTITLDRTGRMVLPQQALDTLGIRETSETGVIIESSGSRAVSMTAEIVFLDANLGFLTRVDPVAYTSAR